MADVICIEGLDVSALIGIYPHESTLRQPLVLDLRLYTDVQEAARRRDFKKTIDYDEAARLATEVATETHHKLIETVAEAIADRLLAAFGDRLTKVWVRVAKPRAVPAARTVAVEIERLAVQPEA